jgi:hypothetical protein
MPAGKTRTSGDAAGHRARKPPRLHVLLARDASDAVVIRRGPAKWSCTIHWDRRTDSFQVGQWLHGRIYERRCDLSPDGKHLIYFALNGKWESETDGTWTAISRAPYLKAIILFGKGDTYHGGGLFTSNTTYWLNSGGNKHRQLRQSRELRSDRKHVPVGGIGSECLGVYVPRLLRDGWLPIDPPFRSPADRAREFEKPVRAGWTLRKVCCIGGRGRPVYWDRHELRQARTDAVDDLTDWEWADLDGERLVWAEKGQLWAGTVTTDGLESRRLLHDFNDMTFEPLKAPY